MIFPFSPTVVALVRTLMCEAFLLFTVHDTFSTWLEHHNQAELVLSPPTKP